MNVLDFDWFQQIFFLLYKQRDLDLYNFKVMETSSIQAKCEQRTCVSMSVVKSKKRLVEICKRNIELQQDQVLNYPTFYEEMSVVRTELDTVFDKEPSLEVEQVLPRQPPGRRGRALPAFIRQNYEQKTFKWKAKRKEFIANRIARIQKRRALRRHAGRGMIFTKGGTKRMGHYFDLWMDLKQPPGFDHMVIRNGEIVQTVFKEIELGSMDIEIPVATSGPREHPDDVIYHRGEYVRPAPNGDPEVVSYTANLTETEAPDRPHAERVTDYPGTATYEILSWTRFFDDRPRWPRDWAARTPNIFMDPHSVRLMPGFPGIARSPKRVPVDAVMFKFLLKVYRLGYGPWVHPYRQVFLTMHPILMPFGPERDQELQPDYGAVMHARFVIPNGLVNNLGRRDDDEYNRFVRQTLQALSENPDGGVTHDYIVGLGVPTEEGRELINQIADIAR